jgi:hypothetical protein
MEMEQERLSRRKWLAIWGGAAGTRVLAQGPAVQETISAHRMGASMGERLRFMGKRLQSTGNSRVSFTGTLQDAQGARPIEIVVQNPGWSRVAVGGAGGYVLTFNGMRIAGGGAEAAERARVMETVIGDLPESVFQQVAAGEVWRHIGNGHRMPGPPERAEYVDVFQPRGAASRAVAGGTGTKVLAFDSSTSLLRFVAYPREGDIRVITYFEDWRKTESEMFPGLIRRLENQKEVFRITLQGLALGGRLQANQF